MNGQQRGLKEPLSGYHRSGASRRRETRCCIPEMRLCECMNCNKHHYVDEAKLRQDLHDDAFSQRQSLFQLTSSDRLSTTTKEYSAHLLIDGSSLKSDRRRLEGVGGWPECDLDSSCRALLQNSWLVLDDYTLIECLQ